MRKLLRANEEETLALYNSLTPEQEGLTLVREVSLLLFGIGFGVGAVATTADLLPVAWAGLCVLTLSMVGTWFPASLGRRLVPLVVRLRRKRQRTPTGGA